MARMIYGRSVKGASHVRNGTHCQDSFKIDEVSPELSIIAVADGHGSEKSPRSEFGSKIATKTFCSIMRQYLMKYSVSLNELITYLNRDGQLKFAQDICEEWQKRIRISFGRSKLERPEGTIDADGNVIWENVYKLYGTTLLGLLVTKTFIFAFQIGDGDIVLVDRDNITPVVETEKILGTETHSLSKPDAWRKAVSAVLRRNAKANTPYLYMLTTDGFVNSYVSEDEYKKSCREYFDMIVEHSFKKVCDNLGGWLHETSELGCGDDITMVLVYVE